MLGFIKCAKYDHQPRGVGGEQATMESHGAAEDRSNGAAAPETPAPIATHESHSDGLGEVARVALKLGLTAFGGPAAHIAMLREETVVRRQWLTDAYFLDLVGATNLIPGPNSTEMVIHVGYLRAGWRGLLVAGTLFILPAATIVLTLGWAYVQYGATPAGEALLYGIKPVVIAVVAQALWGLGRTALKGPLLFVIGAAAAALYLFGVNELAILFGSALAVLLVGPSNTSRPGSLEPPWRPPSPDYLPLDPSNVAASRRCRSL